MRLSSLFWPIFGVGAAAGTGTLLYFGLQKKREKDAEPAAPVSPPVPLTPEVIAVDIKKSADPNELEALARVIASEAGDGSEAEQRAIGWTVRNHFRGKSIYAEEFPWRDQRGHNPSFSSARPATTSSRKMAAEILAASPTADPTGGATAFFEPKMQDVFFKAGELARAGETGSRVIDGVKLSDITRFRYYKKTAADVRSSWSPGSTLYDHAGRFELWGSAKAFAQRGGSVQTIAGDVMGQVVGSGLPATGSITCREALGRMLASERPRGSSAELQAAAWAARNKAARQDTTVASLLCPTGQCGPQDSIRPFASTEQVPTAEADAVAAFVLAQPLEADPTGGAVDFWDPDAHGRAVAKGDLYRAGVADHLVGYAGYTATPSEVRAEYRRRGLRTIGVIGDIELLG